MGDTINGDEDERAKVDGCMVDREHHGLKCAVCRKEIDAYEPHWLTIFQEERLDKDSNSVVVTDYTAEELEHFCCKEHLLSAIDPIAGERAKDTPPSDGIFKENLE